MKLFDIFPFASFIIFSLLLFGKVLILKKRGIKVSAKSKKTRKIKYILHPVFLFIMHVWMFEISRPVFHLSLLPETLTKPLFISQFAKTTGILLIICALILLILTLLHFRKSLRFGMNSNNLGPLITSGIFSFSRNPFFICIEIYFIGIALLIPCVFLIAITLMALIGIHFFILKEEKFMRENYGKEYGKYTKKVRRYF